VGINVEIVAQAAPYVLTTLHVRLVFQEHSYWTANVTQHAQAVIMADRLTTVASHAR